MTIVLNGDTGITSPGGDTQAADTTINGVRVGRGAGAVATNTAVGASALAANTTGDTNTATGYQALTTNTSGTSNTAYGVQALRFNTTGGANASFGRGSLNSNTTGGSNVAIGENSLTSNTTASDNTAVGYQAAYSNTTGYQNAAVGKEALKANTTGYFNNAVGAFALAGNTTGNTNNAMGRLALYANTTGVNSVAIGQEALQANTTAGNNTAVGAQAGYTTTTGSGYNTFIGQAAGYSLTTGSNNVLVGTYAGGGMTTGSLNTFVGSITGGYGAGYFVTTGSKNTIIGGYNGNQGGLDIRTASNYIVLSDGDGNPRGIFDNTGSFLIGKTSGSIANAGVELRQNDAAIFTQNGVCLYINRITTDGTLIEFRQDNATEGSISVSGTTVSYNGGHLSRWAQTTTAKDESLVKGTVLSNLDAMNVYTDADGNPVPNEQLNKVKVSDVEGDVDVAGVFVNWSHDEQHNVEEINMAMTGDMIIRISQGVTVARGDLLMSAGNGTAKPQGDDIVRSKTVAKVTSTHVTCTYADGSFCVPCVLMAC